MGGAARNLYYLYEGRPYQGLRLLEELVNYQTLRL